jgi:hypothetical protein
MFYFLRGALWERCDVGTDESGYLKKMYKFMFSMDSLAVLKSDLCSFSSPLHAYRNKAHANGGGARNGNGAKLCKMF